ncbi:MAG: hypothetical protein AAB700_00355, partial [Patescibacteria group bacterium]
ERMGKCFGAEFFCQFNRSIRTARINYDYLGRETADAFKASFKMYGFVFGKNYKSKVIHPVRDRMRSKSASVID